MPISSPVIWAVRLWMFSSGNCPVCRTTHCYNWNWRKGDYEETGRATWDYHWRWRGHRPRNRPPLCAGRRENRRGGRKYGKRQHHLPGNRGSGWPGHGDLLRCIGSGMRGKMVEQARESYGPVDILVNNAGGAIVGGAGQTFGNYTRDFIDKMIGINLMGAIYGAHAVANEMRERRRGRIINLSSIAGINGSRSNILYGASKGAIIAFTKSLAMDMGPYGVTVNGNCTRCNCVAAGAGKPGDVAGSSGQMRRHRGPGAVHRLGRR